MNVRCLLQRLLLIALSGLVVSCAAAPLPPGAVPNAQSSFAVWSEASIEPALGANGKAIDVVRARGGDVLRVQLQGDAPLLVGERLATGQSSAESWVERTPQKAVLLLRMSAFASALLLPRGAAVRVHRGHGSDPGYHWFELEERALTWASGPLPAPFPELAPPERLDFAGFAALDRALAAAVAAASERASALQSARAVRAVAGLRAVRALRPPTGLPYFLDTAARASAESDSSYGAYPTYAVSAGHALDIPVIGPGILHVWVRAPAGSADAAELSVFEGSRLRAQARSSAPRTPLTSRDALPALATGPVPARRALVHVPPGPHRYRLESTASAAVTTLFAEPVVHLERAGQTDETAQLVRARHACEHGGSAPICALALALLGLDDAAQRADGTSTAWSAALAAASASTRQVALELAQGGPRDPSQTLELQGADGDPAAQGRLGHALEHSLDEGTRAAWVRALTRGTEWRVVAPESESASWSSLAADHLDGKGCGNGGLSEATPVTATEADYQTTLWHGVPVVDFLVASQCGDPQPVQLEVDGQRLTAMPSNALVHWRVRVRGDRAKVRRFDASQSEVTALRVPSDGCHRHFESLRAPVVAARAPVVHLAAEAGAAGLELWLRAGASFAEVTITADASGTRPAQSARLSAPRATGLTAYDAAGVLWTRVARLGLPVWASGTIRISGGDDVAVRALVRVAHVAAAEPRLHDEVTPPVVSLDEAMLVDLTREILALPPERRGALYLRRALVLAAGGARRAALADARAARSVGASGARREDPLPLVQQALRRLPAQPEALPASVNAYGIDSDFEAEAKKCQPTSAGARGELEQLATTLSQAPSQASTRSAFDVTLAVQAAALRERGPLDPRGSRLASRALAGSRWKLRQELGEPAQRVRRPSLAKREGPVDGEGELRPRVAVGARFAGGTYATVLPGRPAQALLAGIPAGGSVRVDVACSAREPAAAHAGCPIRLSLDGQPLAIEIGQDGQGSVRLKNLGGRPKRLLTDLPEQPGEWVALLRLVADRPLPNAVQLDGDHWAIAPRPSEVRTLLADGASLALSAPSPALFRVDARAEGDAAVELVLTSAGRERVVPADGQPVVLPLDHGGTLTLKARGGALTLAVAERVPSDRPADPDEPGATAKLADPGPPPRPAPLSLDAAPAQPQPGWFQLARRSPAPLTPLQAALGTFVAETGAVSGKLHERAPPSWNDAYVFNLVGYRRRIEALQLWTRTELFSRTRPGEPTLGAQASLYEDLAELHLRLSASLKLERQQIAGLSGKSLLARGFVEYSYRAAPQLFILPRLGYDGMSSSVPRLPTSLSYVDDEVYSPYRASRPSFLFAQALFWDVPYFNEILYARLRATFDAKARALSHASWVTGAFLAFGDLDLSGQVQTVWYLPRDSLLGRAHVEAWTGASARYSFWYGLGSLAVTPGLAAAVRPQDAGWQVTAFLNFSASFRRGLRDFSSLELDFPEQLGGGVPWRGSTPGGYR